METWLPIAIVRHFLLMGGPTNERWRRIMQREAAIPWKWTSQIVMALKHICTRGVGRLETHVETCPWNT